MLALILTATAAFFYEVESSIAKREVMQHRQSLYAVAFLGSVWATLILIGWTIITAKEFVFVLESLPTFIVRAILEITLVFVSLSALRDADRSTFAFLRVLSIPLLLLSDVLLGYAFSLSQMIGIGVLLAALLLLASGHGLSGKGKVLALFSAVLAAATVSLYKFNITHFNSVEAEQIIMHAIIFVAIILASIVQGHENVFKYLRRPLCIVQSLAAAIGMVFMSFAYVFAPASVILAMKRSLAIGMSVIFGRLYFGERHLILKLVAFVLLICGIILLSLGV